MVGRVGNPLGIPGEARFGRQIQFAADDRLDAGLLAFQVEFSRAEHIAVVGDRHRRHILSLGLLDQIIEADGTVQQGILGVKMKVDKGA